MAHERWSDPTSEVVRAEPGPRKQPFACVPHTDGFVGLLDVPGLVDTADVPPFVRADARTFTRAVRSLCRGLPRQPSRTRDPRGHWEPANFADLRVPFHAARPSLRAPYWYGTAGMIFVLRQRSSTK